ncbi:hypothetical protein DXG01_016864, partial [Tephrocybe rancida]
HSALPHRATLSYDAEDYGIDQDIRESAWSDDEDGDACDNYDGSDFGDEDNDHPDASVCNDFMEHSDGSDDSDQGMEAREICAESSGDDVSTDQNGSPAVPIHTIITPEQEPSVIELSGNVVSERMQTTYNALKAMCKDLEETSYDYTPMGRAQLRLIENMRGQMAAIADSGSMNDELNANRTTRLPFLYSLYLLFTYPDLAIYRVLVWNIAGRRRAFGTDKHSSCRNSARLKLPPTPTTSMPSLELSTNVKIDNPKDFALGFSKFSADTLAKPEDYITVKYIYNETLTFRGTFDPAFTLNVISLDNLNEELNEKYSKAFFDYFKKNLGIQGDRGYMYVTPFRVRVGDCFTRSLLSTFIDPGRGFLGYQGTTFATIFGK